MSGAKYICCREGRRAALLAGPANLTGIDFVEVQAGATTADPTIITITLVKPIAPAIGTIGPGNVALTGGVRFPAPPIDPNIQPILSGPNIAGYKLTVPGGHPTDFSIYTLSLVSGPGGSGPPPFIDPRLSSVDINFKVGCPTDGDCAPDCAQPPAAPATEAVFDYRNRDWPTLRQAMLDRLTALVPGFAGADPLDLTVTLTEALAAEADRLSYRLDYIGTEAFLATARSRTSIRRHARLVNYRPSEGASARTFAQFQFTPGGAIADGQLTLATATPVLVRQDGLMPVVSAVNWPSIAANAPMTFETTAPLTLWSWRNAIAFHTWSDDECQLPAGATEATLIDTSGNKGSLQIGDLLLLREIASPVTGLAADASPSNRWVVRLTAVNPVVDPLAAAGTALVEVAWDPADALPFALTIAAKPTGAPGAAASATCANAAGNLVVADHGLTLPPPATLGLPSAAIDALRPQLQPPQPIGSDPWRPTLSRAGLARSLPATTTPPPASTALTASPSDVLPALRIDDVFSQWTARADLLNSGPFERDFVVEPGMNGFAQLRFGDGVHGLAPPADSQFAASGRFGSGLAGNIGAGALGHVVLPTNQIGGTLVVTNPLPARSGADPEPISAVRLNAPYAFRRQDRAVTAADYAAVAMRHPNVIAAIAIPRWTGAFQTMLVYVDRRDGLKADVAFLAEVAAFLEHYRLMGFDVAVRAAAPAPLDIALFVCAAPRALAAAVGAAVRDALHPRQSNGQPGFFDPNRFTFGAPLWLAALVAAVMAVDGVQSVEVTSFQRYGRVATGEVAAGVIRPNGPEVLQLADDPNFPERGRLRIAMGGGR